MAKKVFDFEPETSYRLVSEFPAAEAFRWYFEATSLLWPDGDDAAWLIRLWWHVIDGRAEVVGLEIHSTHRDTQGELVIGELRGGPLNATFLRSVPLGSLIEEGRRMLTEMWKDQVARIESGEFSALEMDEDVVEKLGWDPRVPSPAARRLILDDTRQRVESLENPPPRRRYDEEHWARVAAVYDEAWAAGSTPTKDVAEYFGVTRSTAAKWVSICRKKGLLPPTQKTKPRGNPKIGGADGVGDKD